MKGWIKLHRRISNNHLWTDEPFTRGQAWVDLLLLANYKTGHIRVRGVKVELERGQVGWSRLKLSRRWNWSRGKVDRFLNELEEDKQIKQQKDRVTSVITIVKYQDYQGDDTTDGALDGHETEQHIEQSTEHLTDTKKKYKKNKNLKRNTKEAQHREAVESYVLPDYFDDELKDMFSDLADNRLENKDYLTTRAIKALIKKTEGRSIDDIKEAFNNAIASGWKSLYFDNRSNANGQEYQQALNLPPIPPDARRS